MKKSDEPLEGHTEVPDKVDYSNLPKEIEGIIEPVSEEIVEDVRISFDGRQYVVRFPTEISKLKGISTEQKIRFALKLPHPKTNEEPELTITLIEK